MENQFAHLRVNRVVMQFYYDDEPDKLYKMPFSGLSAFHAYLKKHPEITPSQVLMRYIPDL